MLKTINMRYPEQLLKRIEAFQKRQGFATRTQTIIYLIHTALELEDRGE